MERKEKLNLRGWRARIGLVVPSVNPVAEVEMHTLCPMGVTVHTARTLGEREEWTDEGIKKHWDKMIENLEKAALELSTAKVDAIAWVCTSGSFFGGPGWDKKLIKKMERISETPATTTSTCMVEALKEMKVKTAAVATPYPPLGSKLLKEFLEGNGVKVVNIEQHTFPTMGELFEAPPEMVYRLVKKVNRPEAEAIFISDTAFPTIEIIGDLESDLGKPVISANTATFWGVLRKAGIRDSIKGYGRLLEKI